MFMYIAIICISGIGIKGQCDDARNDTGTTGGVEAPVNEWPFHEASERLHRLVRDCDKLSSSKANEDASAELICAFIELCGKLKAKPDDGTKDENRVLLARFLGFVEGRLGVRCPEWWSTALLSAGLNADGELQIEKLQPWRYVRTGRLSVREGMSVDFAVTGGARVIAGERSLTLSRDDLNTPGDVHAVDVVDVVWHDGAAYAALSEGHHTGCQLLAHQDDGKKKWSAIVWGNWRSGFATGPAPVQFIDIQWFGKTIAVFGVSGHTMYVETFDSDNGHCKSRFSTRLPLK